LRPLAGLIRNAARRGGNLGAFAWQRHVLGRRIIEKPIYDYRLFLDADDPGISRQLIRLGEREPEQKWILERELEPGMRALDLGANIGYYTVMMARLVGPGGRVYAVEPFPANFDLLGRNVRRNAISERTELERVAIARADGEMPLLISDRSNWHSLHPPEVDPAVSWQRKYCRTMKGSVPVRTRALAGYLAERPPLDLMRMDIEGYETEILRAVLALPVELSRRLRILFETHPEFYQPRRNDPRPVLEALCSNGYVVKYLVSDFHYQDGRALFERYGYGAAHVLKQFRTRAVYTGVAPKDAIDLICGSECVHAAFLARSACD
jgi:FkbM family methyltransferase